MDTDGVRLFVQAAELLNISAAGRKLGLSPAVASARLAKLENHLGADLLHRSTRKVALSLEGSEFLPFAKEIIAQEDAALAALGRGTTDVRGTIRFAASSTFAQLYLAPILPEFLQKYPAVDLDLKLSDTQTDLIQGGFDLALRNFAVADSSLICRKLANDTRVLCASPDYIKAHGQPQSPQDLLKHQFVVFQGGAARRLSNGDGDAAHLYPPADAKVRMSCDDGASLRIAIGSGAGIGMSSLWSVHHELEAGTLVRVLPDYQIEDDSAIWLIYPKSNVLTAKTRILIDFLLEKIGQSPPWLRRHSRSVQR
ncbi:MAG: LysR family transcriptional regulator [Alphaproteobacteria bacterium]